MQLVKDSISHCISEAYSEKGETNTATLSELSAYNKMMKQPARFVVANVKGYGEVLKKAATNLERDGCKMDVFTDGVVWQNSTEELVREPNSALGKALKSVKIIMKNCDHAIYKGDIYRKSPKGKYLNI